MAENARLFMRLTKRSSNELIGGEAVVTEFAGQIELEDWSWDISREPPASTTGRDVRELPPASRERIKPQPFRFSKYTDRSTTAILSAMVANELLKAEVVLEEAAEVDFRLVVLLDKVRVLGFEVEADIEDIAGRAQERWTFDYESLQFNYNGSGTVGATSVRIERAPGGRGILVGRSEAARAFAEFAAWRQGSSAPNSVDWKAPAGTPDWKGAAAVRPQ